MFLGILYFLVGIFAGAAAMAFIQGADQQEEDEEEGWMDYVDKF